MSKFNLKLLIFIYILTFIYNECSGNYGKIKGGRAAKRGEFPFAGHLSISTGGRGVTICGCSLVTTAKVVTAGHCVIKWEQGTRIMLDPKTGKVYFGTLYLMSDEGQTSKIDTVKYPKEIREKKLGGVMHDYAIAMLVTPLKITDNVKPMSIFSTNKAEFKNGWDELVSSKTTCVIIGWGATEFKIINSTTIETGRASRFLKTADVKPLDEEQCAKFAGPPRDNMLPFGEVCIMGVVFGETALPGDSGGPLMCGDYVWGVCSSMFVDKTRQKPFIYLLHWHYLNEFLYPDAAGIASASFPKTLVVLFCLVFSLS